MTRPKIKICGNTNLSDSKMVASFRPDYMGWIFSPHSIRQINQESAATFIQEVKQLQPKIQHVGVFAGNSVESIVDLNKFLTQNQAALDFFQVVESAEFVAELRKADSATAIIPVIRPTRKIQNADFEPYNTHKTFGRLDALDTLKADKKNSPPFYILDRFDATAKGGTGKQIDADFFAPVRFQFLVAGGINPTNALEILKLSGAIGIDLSSGVESTPGKKDKAKLEQLFRNVWDL